MKKWMFVLISFFLFSACDSESASECLKRSGTVVSQSISLSDFEEVAVYGNIQLTIQQAQEYKAEVKVGKNLLDGISLEVIGSRLEIRNNNDCSWVRGKDKAEVILSAPNLKYIRNASQYAIESLGVLNYYQLLLISEDYWESGGNNHYTTGDFRLTLDVEELSIVNNNLSNYFLDGKAAHIYMEIASGDGRVDARHLKVKDADFYHRGSQDLILHVQNAVKGTLLSTGNLILVHTPEEVEVESLYSGKVIYE